MAGYSIKLYFGAFLIFSGICVQALIFALDAPKALGVYPYVLIALLGGIGLFSAAFDVYSSKLVLSILGMCIIPVVTLFIYQWLFMDVQLYYVLYMLKFYFGSIFIVPLLLFFMKSVNDSQMALNGFVVRFVEVLIMFNFVLCVLEQLGHAKGIVMPWVPKHLLDTDLSVFSGYIGLPRCYGYTGNAAVLGGWSIFLTLFYYGQSGFAKTRLYPIVILAGAATAVLSQSGTAFYAAIIAVGFVLAKNIAKGKWMQVFGIGLIVLVAYSLISYRGFGEGSRYKLDSLAHIITFHGNNVFSFVKSEMEGSWINFLLGAKNYMELVLNQDHVSLIEGSSGMYDFALLALFLETGVLGLLTYLGFIFLFIKLSFKSFFDLRAVACLILLLSSLHYGVAFWICSQVMLGFIFAVNLHVSRLREFEAQNDVSLRAF